MTLHAVGKDGDVSTQITPRLEYIDFKLFFTGRVSRADLNAVFGIAEAAASRVLTQYATIRPNNKTQKTNTILRETFVPLCAFDPDEALGMLANGFNRYSRPVESDVTSELIGRIPNQLNLENVAKITRAISGHYAISCNYLSENSDNHDTRILVPLAIMHDGTSWLFRAFDRSESSKPAFKNFHFARVRAVKEELESNEAKQKSGEVLSQDTLWNLRLPLVLTLHESLSQTQRMRVITDFGIDEGKEELYVTERAAFRWILEKKWYIDARSQAQIDEDNQKGIRRFYKFKLANLATIEQMENA
ncbi:TPA: WYL domain-containing protein [Vibrio vulnificus]|uniref:WYL domain-containing protein n=1 Tax=Vibrio vulnificus TaxID=672 RepID=UPI001268338C|nr:hypothetical protein FIU99_14970 [Vibrio sp. THAF64]QGM35616.1 hypothetical protein GGC04_14980 [Vibrio sp. THAF191d]QGN71116.1 hypothetical protein GGC03_14975 [Vibrio sp. THAF191c]HDY7744141.1 WYL domain-containing protein [Vibrio vulnificus]HDY7780907.1 WYL domain-containing protein [Vibrio vulnificus]